MLATAATNGFARDQLDMKSGFVYGVLPEAGHF